MDNLSEKVTLIVISSIFLLTIAVGIIILVLVYQKKQLQHINERNNLKNALDNAILGSKLEIQEQILKKISQEIHDNIGQVLSLAKLNINTMRSDEPESLQSKISNSKQLISKAIQDLRDLSRSLHTDYIVEKGLMQSLAYELEMIKKTGELETILHIEGTACRLEQQQELILFRIVQEILHNIIKHARATLIDVRAQFDPEWFILTVRDNGIGFDAGKLKDSSYNSSGLGIRNMFHRAKMINTDFNLESTINKGVTVTLRLPLPKAAG